MGDCDSKRLIESNFFSGNDRLIQDCGTNYSLRWPDWFVIYILETIDYFNHIKPKCIEDFKY